MTMFRSLVRLALVGVMSLTAGVALAQHDVGGGATKDVASPAGDATGRRGTSVKRTTPTRKPAAPARRGTTAEQFYQKGNAFFQAEQYDEALDAYTRAVQLKPIAGAYYFIGWIHNDQGNYAQAIAPLTQAQRLRTDYAEPHNELGYAYYKLGQSENAIAAYRAAVRIKPDFGLAHLGLGDVYYHLTRQYREAMEAYRQGVRLKSDNPDAFYKLAWCYNEFNMYADAAAAANQAITLKANYPEAYNELGYANRRLGAAQQKGSPPAQRLFSEAIVNYREAIRLKPGYGLAFTGLGDVYYLDLGQCQQAVAPYEQAIRISPDNVRVHYNLGWCYNDLKRYPEAVEKLREAVRLKPEYAEAHTELGYAYLQSGSLPAAVQELRTAIQLKDAYALAHYYLGLAFIGQRNRNGALEQYRILQRLDPEKAKQLYDRAPAAWR